MLLFRALIVPCLSVASTSLSDTCLRSSAEHAQHSHFCVNAQPCHGQVWSLTSNPQHHASKHPQAGAHSPAIHAAQRMLRVLERICKQPGQRDSVATSLLHALLPYVPCAQQPRACHSRDKAQQAPW